jgi:hypothetical protein
MLEIFIAALKARWVLASLLNRATNLKAPQLGHQKAIFREHDMAAAFAIFAFDS